MGTIKFNKNDKDESTNKNVINNEAIKDVEKTKDEPTILFEDISKREESAKHFKMSDGTYKAFYYGSPVHYLNSETGVFEPIDNTLEYASDSGQEDGFEGYVNKAHDLKVKFAKKVNDKNVVAIQKGEHSLALKLLGRVDVASANSCDSLNSCEAQIIKSDDLEAGLNLDDPHYYTQNLTNEIRYNDFISGADLQYILTSNGVKENIIVKERLENYEFAFKLKTKNLELKLAEDQKSIEFIADKTNDDGESIKETIFTMPAPYMSDAGEGHSEDIVYCVDNLGEDEYLFKLIPNAEWLNATDRVFPVIIDPTITRIGHEQIRINGLSVSFTGLTTGNYPNQSDVLIGRSNLGRSNVAIFRFNNINIPQGLIEMNLRAQTTAGSAGRVVDLYAMPHNDWIIDDIALRERSTNLVFNHGGNVSLGRITARQVDRHIIDDDGRQINFRMTENLINNGVVFYTRDGENRFRIYTSLGSSTRQPVLTMVYSNHFSTEQYYSSIGRAGTGMVDLQNGSVKWVHENFALNGLKLPLQLHSVYDSNFARLRRFGMLFNPPINMGRGWKTNLHQYLIPYPYAGTTSNTASNNLPRPAWLYIDHLGVEHVLWWGRLQNTNGTMGVEQIRSASGHLILESSSNGNVQTLRDRNGNSFRFARNGTSDWFRLNRISDETGNKDISFDTENRISTITDAARRLVTFRYNGPDSLLNQIEYTTDNNKVVTSFDYDNNNTRRLSRIVYPDSNHSFFSYNNNHTLHWVGDQTGHCLWYNYENNKVIRINESSNIRSITDSFIDPPNPINGTVLATRPVTHINYNENLTTIWSSNNANSRTRYTFIMSELQRIDRINQQGQIESNLLTQSLSSGQGEGITDQNAWLRYSTTPLGQTRLSVGPNLDSNFRDIDGREVISTVNTDGNIIRERTNTRRNTAQARRFDINYKYNENGRVIHSIDSGNHEQEVHVRSKVIMPTFPVGRGVRLAGDSIEFSLTRYFRVPNLPGNIVVFENEVIWRNASLFSSDFFAMGQGTHIPLFVSNNAVLFNSNTQPSRNGSVHAFPASTSNVGWRFDSNTRCLFVVAQDGTSLHVADLIPQFRGTHWDFIDGELYLLSTSSQEINSKMRGRQGSMVRFFGKNSDTTNSNNSDNFLYRIDDLTQRALPIATTVFNPVSGKLESLTLDNEHVIDYSYNAVGNLETVTTKIDEKTIINTYNYRRGCLTRLEVYDTIVQNNNRIKHFEFAYDGFGVCTRVTVGAMSAHNALVDKSYHLATNINEQNYEQAIYRRGGQGDYTKRIEFDKDGKPIAILGRRHTNPTINELAIAYDNANRVDKIINRIGETEDTINYDYIYNPQDANHNITNSVEITGNFAQGSISETVNQVDQLVSKNVRFVAPNQTTADSYSYEYTNLGVTAVDGITTLPTKLRQIVLPNGGAASYEYDLDGRLESKNHSINQQIKLKETYSYRTTLNQNYLTNQVSFINYEWNTDKSNQVEYQYDAHGRVRFIIDANGGRTQYEYDAAGRITREDNQAFARTRRINYRADGNILNIRDNEFSPNVLTANLANPHRTVAYHYCNRGRLFLTTVNGTPSENMLIDPAFVHYDNLGNPLNYKVPLHPSSITWRRKGDLVRYGENSYAYDAMGARVTKSKNNSLTHKFYAEGGIIYREDRFNAGVVGGINCIRYIYDATGIAGLEDMTAGVANRKSYWFMKNAFGDIIALIDEQGIMVAKYEYDAWGNHVVLAPSIVGQVIASDLTKVGGWSKAGTNHIGNINPWRWRGQYFDTETGFYAVHTNGITRYYDPALGIIINATLDEAEMDGHNAFESPNPLEIFPVKVFSEPTWGYPRFWQPTAEFFAAQKQEQSRTPGVFDFWNGLPTWAQVTLGGVALAGTIALAIVTAGVSFKVKKGVAAAAKTVKTATTVAKFSKGAAIGSGINAGVGFVSGGLGGGDGWSWSGAGRGFGQGAVSGAISGALGVVGKDMLGLSGGSLMLFNAGTSMATSALVQVGMSGGLDLRKVIIAGLFSTIPSGKSWASSLGKDLVTSTLKEILGWLT